MKIAWSKVKTHWIVLQKSQKKDQSRKQIFRHKFKVSMLIKINIWLLWVQYVKPDLTCGSRGFPQGQMEKVLYY